MIAAALLACAANIAPATLDAVIAVESRGDPLALHVDGLRRQPHPADAAEAARVALAYIRAGYRVDLGLMQVNSANLPALGLSVGQVLDSCTNVGAGGTILTADYAAAAQRWGEGQEALRHALVAYNSGRFRGDRTYLARYYGPGGIPVMVAAAYRAASNPHPAPALARGRKNGQGPRRPSPAPVSRHRAGFARARLWTASMIARLGAPSSVYSNQRVAFAIR
jgi:type IV secretion system protein VirB1